MTDRVRYFSGVLALVTVALILGSIPTALKAALVYFPPAVQFAIRFLIGAVALTPFLREFSWNLLRDSAILGVVVFATFACETIGLETLSANRASFIFGLNIIFVTLFEVIFKRRMALGALGASGLTFAGIAVMSWEDTTDLTGDMWLLAAALGDATSIILLEKFAPQYNPIALATVRVWCVAILGLVWAGPNLATEQFALLQEHWGALHYLGLVATALVIWLYTVGLQRVSAYEAAVFLALEPVFGATISFFVLGETFGLRGFIGALMVLSGIFLIIKFSQNQIKLPIEPVPIQTESPQIDG